MGSVRTYESVTGEYEEVVGECVFGEPSVVWVSTVTGDVVSAGEVSDPAYWIRQVRAPVRFAEAVRTLESSGVSRYVECGPAYVRACVMAGVPVAPGTPCVAEPAVFVATKRGAEESPGEVRSMLRALGAACDGSGHSLGTGLHHRCPGRSAGPCLPARAHRPSESRCVDLALDQALSKDPDPVVNVVL
jgi:hypothetical protein